MGVEQVLQRGQVARCGRDDPGVHHDRLDDHPGHPARMGLEEPLDRGQVVEAGHQGQVEELLGDPRAPGDPGRQGGGAHVLRVGGDGDLHRVVVAVVAALDLDDEVPAGDGAHEVDGVHGGLGARVVEAPQRQVEPAGQLLGDLDGRLGRLGEVGAAADLCAHRLRDGRVGVAGEAGTVAAVEVDVLVAVDVEDLGALAVADPHRLGRGDLPARGDPAGEAVGGPLAEHRGVRLAGDERLLFGGDQRIQDGSVLLRRRHLDGHCGLLGMVVEWRVKRFD